MKQKLPPIQDTNLDNISKETYNNKYRYLLYFTNLQNTEDYWILKLLHKELFPVSYPNDFYLDLHPNKNQFRTLILRAISLNSIDILSCNIKDITNDNIYIHFYIYTGYIETLCKKKKLINNSIVETPSILDSLINSTQNSVQYLHKFYNVCLGGGGSNNSNTNDGITNNTSNNERQFKENLLNDLINTQLSLPLEKHFTYINDEQLDNMQKDEVIQRKSIKNISPLQIPNTTTLSNLYRNTITNELYLSNSYIVGFSTYSSTIDNTPACLYSQIYSKKCNVYLDIPYYGNHDIYIATIGIRPTFQGLKLGTLILIATLQSAIRQDEPLGVGLHVLDGNYKAIHLYKKIGFHIDARLHDHYKENHVEGDALYLHRYILYNISFDSNKDHES